MAEQPITRDLIGDITPADDTVVFTIGPSPSGVWGKFTLADLATYMDAEANQITVEEFTGLASGTQVTLASTPSQLLSVKRNGIEALASEYSLASNIITFTETFGPSTGATGSESVNVMYK